MPVVITSTNSDGRTTVQTTDAFQTSAQTSVAVAITTTNSRGQTITTSTMAPAAIITSTDSRGSAVTTTSPLSNVAVAPGGSVVSSAAGMVTTTDSDGQQVVLTSPTPGGVYTVTDKAGRIATITWTPSGGVVSQVQLATTTLPNGQRSTITSFAVVGGAGGATSGPGQSSGSSPSSTTKPGLQSGAAAPSSWYAAEVAMLVGAAVGVAGLVL